MFVAVVQKEVISTENRLRQSKIEVDDQIMLMVCMVKVTAMLPSAISPPAVGHPSVNNWN
jgi:hypothetical protein